MRFSSRVVSGSSRRPMSSLVVSIIISMPARMMNPAMTTPTYASSETPQSRNTTAEASTEPERIASNSASEPEASSAPEWNFRPCRRTYIPRISLTTMATEMMISDTAL